MGQLLLAVAVALALLGDASGQATPAAPATPAASQTSARGRIILHSFEHAPYPHASREDGWTYKDRKFPREPNYSDSTVGIVIPAGYTPGESVDYIVHFHGWSNHVAKVIPQYQLLEQLAASKVNAILLVPQGPKDAQDSGGGKLENDPGAFAKLIDEVTAYLNSTGEIHTHRVGRIVLTAHSGGYKVTAAITHLGGMNDRITDVLLLDASYGSLEWFADWAKADPSHRLVSLFTDHLADANQELMGDLDKLGVKHITLDEPTLTDEQLRQRTVIFMHVKGPHDEVPNQYFGQLIRTSALAK
jgi:hypothetical protein